MKGSFLASALLYAELGDVLRKLENVTFYLDTSLLLRALGLSGQPDLIAARELLDLLYASNGRLDCFRHTLDEMSRCSMVPHRTRSSFTGAARHGTGRAAPVWPSSQISIEPSILRVDRARTLSSIARNASSKHSASVLSTRARSARGGAQVVLDRREVGRHGRVGKGR